MDFQTADLCDAHAPQLQIATPLLRHYGGRTRFGGRIETLKLFEDNSLVRATLATPGEDRILVVDGGGSLRCALVGDQLGTLAVENGWAGIVVYGCIRDSAALGTMPLGVMALGTHPLKSDKRDEGRRGLPVSFAGVTFRPGEWLYGDEDGIVLSATALV